MKILIVSDAWYPQVNGVVRTYENLHDKLVEWGHDVKIIGPRDFPARIPLPGYPEIKLAVMPYFRLKRLIRNYDPDVIHIATEGPLGEAGRRYCLRHFPKGFTTCYHTQFPDYVAKRVARYLPFLERTTKNLAITKIRKFHKPASAMFVATRTLEDQLNERGFTPPKIRLTRGIDEAVFYPGKKEVFRDLEKPVAIYVGRIAIEKNLEDFLEMDWPGSKVLVGDGPSLPALKSRYPDAVFAGVKTGKELGDHYRSADIFAFPSTTDTFGMVIIEGLACGLPVAAYDVMGPRDILVEDYLGAMDADLGRAARTALERGKPELCAAYIKEHFTWDVAASQFLSGLTPPIVPGETDTGRTGRKS